jgi:hypothetical protein
MKKKKNKIGQTNKTKQNKNSPAVVSVFREKRSTGMKRN